MINENKIYNYIKIFIFTILIMLVIPKEAYKEIANMNIVIDYNKKENSKLSIGNYITPQQGYTHDILSEKIDKEGYVFIKNPTKIYEKYTISLLPVGEVEIKNIKILRGKNEKIILKNEIISKNKVIEINEKDFLSIGKISYKKIGLYFFLILMFIKLYLENYIYKIDKKINARRALLYILGFSSFSLFLNDRIFTRMIGIYLVFSLIYFIDKNKKLKFNKITFFTIFLYIYENINKYYFNKQHKFSVDHYYLTATIASLWQYKKVEYNFLGKMLYFSLFIVGLINYNSSLVFSNIFCFPFGTIMAILSVICIYRIFNKEKNNFSEILRKIIEFTIFILSINNIIFSDRRTAMVAFLIVCSLIVVVNLFRKINNKIVLFIFVILISIVTVKKESIKLAITNKFERTLQRGEEGSNEARLLMWRKSFFIIKENPLGIGEGNFKSEYVKEKYKKIEHPREKLYGVYEHPHNEYFNEIVNKGIIWGTIYLSLIFLALKNGIKKFIKKKDTLNFYLLVALLICGMFEPFRYMEKNILSIVLISNLENYKTINLLKKNKYKKIILFLLLSTLLLKSTVNIILIIGVLLYLIIEIWRKYGKQRITKKS